MTKIIAILAALVAVIVLAPSVHADVDPGPTSLTVADEPPLSNPRIEERLQLQRMQRATSSLGPAVEQYLVQPDDTYTFLAQWFNVTEDALRASNPARDTLSVGDALLVPTVEGVVYKVIQGDTLDSIAQWLGVEVQTIVSLNLITNPDMIQPGALYTIPGVKYPLPARGWVGPPPITPTPTPNTPSNPFNAPMISPPTGPISNHFTFGYCTWWVAQQRPIPWFGNAIEWWGNARAYGYAEGRTPRVGAVVVENLSSLGHVAYVTSVGPSSFTVSEMNYNGWDVVDYRTIANGAGEIIGFIY